jgi:hypothetical protein
MSEVTLEKIRRKILAACAAILIPVALRAQIDVFTNRYDAARSGANLVETTLTAANVNVNEFGRLYSYPIDGAVYAQPLYVTGVVMHGIPRNVLYVATMNDKVYAFDADSASSSPLWIADFTSPPAVTPVPITDIVSPTLNIFGNVGIESTPVIDRAAGALYLVARTKENGSYVQRLHALDITTGRARAGSPITIGGSVPGLAQDATPGADGSVLSFDPKLQQQRAALALSNGVVLVSWGSHQDKLPYHGWIMGFDANTLAPVGVFAVTPDFYGGGVWQGGRAPAIDAAGNAYFATGNGKWDGVRNFGDSLLKFSVSQSGMMLVDYFTPGNEAQLAINDDDLSGSGFTLLPGTNLLLGGGKEGVLYLVDAANLGHKVANDTQIIQKVAVHGGHVMGGPVFWSSSSAGPLVYNWAEDDVLTALRLTAGRLTTTPYAQGQVRSLGHPGGSLTVSANGSAANSGIVWASMPTSQDALRVLTAGILRAFNAETLAEIWTSEQNPARDRVGTLIKFVPPVVANGKVYMPSQNNAVAVYGLLPADFSVGVTPGSSVISSSRTGIFSVAVGAQGAFDGRVDLSASGAPPGTTVTFNPQSITGSGVATMTIAVPADAAAGSFTIVVTASSGALSHFATPLVVDVSTAPAGLGAIGIDFVGSGTPMAAAERAGVVPQSRWNNAAGASSLTAIALVDESGAATGARAAWTAAWTWSTPAADQPGNARLMKGYLDTSNTSTTTIAVDGLILRSYDVYIYADGANGTFTRTAAYTISGPGIATATATLGDAAGTNFSGTFTQADNSNGNYVKFNINASAFTVTAAPSTGTNATLRAPVNGIQIVPASVAPPPPPPPQAIAIDFVGNSATVMAPTESAGVVAQAHWNNAVGAASSSPLALVDRTGAATNATITWIANNTWVTPTADQAGNIRMMRGYLDTSSTSTTTITVAGLPAGVYDVYVYADGANGGFSRTAAYTMSGPTIATTRIELTDRANTNYAQTFTPASNGPGNYVKFSIAAGEFTLTARPVSGANTTLRAPVNGIQIVPIAPPP